MQHIVKLFETEFLKHQNPQSAAKQAAYLRNLFPFFGIAKPKREEIEKPLLRLHKMSDGKKIQEVVSALWMKEEREFHYAALSFLRFHHKLWDRSWLAFFEGLIRTHSWWDTVDTIAPNCVGTLIAAFPELGGETDRWIFDDNFWIRRSAILHQLRYREKTNSAKLFEYCLRCGHEKEFFIRKAIGWALREYSKTHPEAVAKFLSNHSGKLSSLSVREAERRLAFTIAISV